MAKGTLYTFTYANGEGTFGFNDGSSVTIPRNALTAEVEERALFHGIKQKVADAAAIPRDTVTGRSANDADKIRAMRAVVERLLAGTWAVSGGGGVSSDKMFLIRAMAEYSGKSLEEAREFVEDKTKTQQTALMGNAKIKPIIDRMRAESVGNIDSDDLLEEFV